MAKIDLVSTSRVARYEFWHELLYLFVPGMSAAVICPPWRRTCWFHEAALSADGAVHTEGDHKQHGSHAPLTTLLALEHTIQERREAMEQQQGMPA